MKGTTYCILVRFLQPLPKSRLTEEEGLSTEELFLSGHVGMSVWSFPSC